MSKNKSTVILFAVCALLVAALACGSEATSMPAGEKTAEPAQGTIEDTGATEVPPTPPATDTPAILTVQGIEEQRNSDLTDLQWEAYVDRIIGQPILFSGKVIEVYDDGRVQIDEGKRLLTVCILHSIPRDMALAITKNDYLEGEGTVRDIDTALGLSVHVTINTLNGETITSPQEPQPPSEKPGATPVVGTSRSNPYPASEIASAPNWDVQVREIVRGDAAWQAIQAANMFNDPPPEGMEYLLVKLWVKSNYSDDETHSITGSDFQVTGDHLVRYGYAGVVEPDPQLYAELYADGEVEGWVAFAVAEGEGNLILIIAELFSFDEDTFRFLALDEGAAIELDYELDLIAPTAVGRSRSDPAPLGETVTSEDWQITVLEVVRGTEAWTMVQEANQFNDAPTEGMEYVAVRMRMRYIGTADEAVSVNTYDLKSTGSVGQLYDTPWVVYPEPALEASLYPGAQVEGWAILQATVGETELMAVFEPSWDFSGDNTRYLSLES